MEAAREHARVAELKSAEAALVGGDMICGVWGGWGEGGG